MFVFFVGLPLCVYFMFSYVRSAMVRHKQVASSEASSDHLKDNDNGKPLVDNTHGAEQMESVDVFDIDEEFRKLFLKYKKKGLTGKEIAKSKVLKDIDFRGSYRELFLKYLLYFLIALTVAYVAIVVNCAFSWPIKNETLHRLWFKLYDADIETEHCSVYIPESVNDIFRPPVECSFCRGVKEVKTVYNISQDEFEDLYAYTGVPVVIGDGTANWTAPKYFSFDFFKKIYANGSVALNKQQQNCQFFPYKTDFRHLGEVFQMSKERALMTDGSKPWYIGW